MRSRGGQGIRVRLRSGPAKTSLRRPEGVMPRATAKAALLVLVMLVALVGSARAATNKSGTISADETWDLAGSPNRGGPTAIPRARLMEHIMQVLKKG